MCVRWTGLARSVGCIAVNKDRGQRSNAPGCPKLAVSISIDGPGAPDSNRNGWEAPSMRGFQSSESGGRRAWVETNVSRRHLADTRRRCCSIPLQVSLAGRPARACNPCRTDADNSTLRPNLRQPGYRQTARGRRDFTLAPSIQCSPSQHQRK